MKFALLTILVFGCMYKTSCTESKCDLEEEFRQSLKDIISSLEEVNNKIQHLEDNDRKQLALIQNEATVLNDSTIEERVAVLEFQVAALTDDTMDLEESVSLIAVEQVIQDEKILELEFNSAEYEEAIENLVASDVDVYLELGELNGRLTIMNSTINDVSTTVIELDTELTVLEDIVSQIDTRLSELEVSGTVAFQADLDIYTSIPIGSVVVFDVVHLNISSGYNNATGEFTVPSGGDGLYFFYINFFADDMKITDFVVRLNGGTDLCYARADMNNVGVADNGTPTCGAVATVSAGDVVNVVHVGETDDHPVNSDTRPYNTFTGFRIAPQ